MDAFQLHPSFALDFDTLGQEEEGFHRRFLPNRVADGALSPITLGRLEAAWKEDHTGSSTGFLASPPRPRYGHGSGNGMHAPSFSAHRRTPTFSTEVNEVDFDFFSTPSSSRAAKAANLARKNSSSSASPPSSPSCSSSRLPGSSSTSSSAAPQAQVQTTPRRNGNGGASMLTDIRPVLTTSSSGQASVLNPSSQEANGEQRFARPFQYPPRNDLAQLRQADKASQNFVAPSVPTGRTTGDSTHVLQDGPSSPHKQPFSFEDAQRQHQLLMSQARQRANAGQALPGSASSVALNLAKRGLFNERGEQIADGAIKKEQAESGDDFNDEAGHPTPLAASRETFGGQRPAVALGATPATPLYHQGPRRYGHAHNDSTPSSSFSLATTPEHADGYQSPFYHSNVTPGSYRAPLQRGQSYQSDSVQPNGAAHHMHTFSQPLHDFWAYGGPEGDNGEEEATTPGAEQLHQQQQQQQQARMNAYGHAHSASEQLQSPPGGLSLFHRRAQQNAMSRVASAPALAAGSLPASMSAPSLSHQHLQQQLQSPSHYTAWREDSVPTTPGSSVSWATSSSIPGTPAEMGGLALASPGYAGANGMTPSRSVGALAASTANMAPFFTPPRQSAQHFGAGAEGYSFPPTASATGENSSAGPTKHVKKNSRSQGRASTATTPRKHTSSRSQSGLLTGGASGSPAAPPLVVSSADKLHVCHCGKRFKRMEHLKRHNRTHTQERPHKCPVDGCGKYFGRTDNLSQHLKTHFRATGLARASQHLLAMSAQQGGEHHQLDMRHDPHAAAAEAARAAIKAAEGAARNGGGMGVEGGDSDSDSGSPSGDEAGSDEMVLGGPISFGATNGGSIGPGPGGKQHHGQASPQQHFQQQQHLQHLPHQYSYHHQQQGVGGHFTRQVLGETNGANAPAQGQRESMGALQY